jgi:hypothetical protein
MAAAGHIPARAAMLLKSVTVFRLLTHEAKSDYPRVQGISDFLFTI